jgi:phage gpG-like protein
MLSLEVDAKQLEEYGKYLQDLSPQIDKATERALDEAAASILNRLRTTFRQEVAPDGTPWLPSKAGLRHKQESTGQTLFDSGNLWRSIQLSRKTAGARFIGTDVEYARYHQGPEAGVQRTFLAISEEHIKMASRVFQNRLLEVFK